MGSEPQKPKRGRPKTLDRDHALSVAVEEYWKADPADVSINAICHKAGISKPALYREFGNEDGLTRAALERYGQQVLSDIFVILAKNNTLQRTLSDLADFVSDDPKMETGCLFYKMRAGKHRLGPSTRAAVEAIDAKAVETFSEFLQEKQTAGEWKGNVPLPVASRYLVEHIGLALTQRAAGEDRSVIRSTFTLALSALNGVS